MSTRVITERELLHNLAFEVSELREHVAELGTKVARLDVLVDERTHSTSVRALSSAASRSLLTERCSCGRMVVREVAS